MDKHNFRKTCAVLNGQICNCAYLKDELEYLVSEQDMNSSGKHVYSKNITHCVYCDHPSRANRLFIGYVSQDSPCYTPKDCPKSQITLEKFEEFEKKLHQLNWSQISNLFFKSFEI